MRRRLILVGLFFALMFVYAGANAYLNLVELRDSSDRGWRMGLPGTRPLVSSARREGSASALRFGDEIIALDNRQVERKSEIDEFFRRVKPGSSFTIVVERDGELLEFTLRTEPFPLSYITLLIVLFLIVPAAFLLIGLTVFVLKPDNKQALLLALMFGTFILAGQYSLADLEWWLLGIIIAGRICALFLLPVSLHLFLVFPERSPLLRRFPRLEFYIYLPYLLITFPYVLISNVLRDLAPESVQAFASLFPQLFTVVSILALLYIGGGMLSQIITYRWASQSSRRRIRIVTIGVVAGFSPYLLLNSSYLLFDLRSRVSLTLLEWLTAAAFSAALLVPVSFGYAIVRHQVIPVRLIVRRGLQYLLAKNALRVILALPVIGLVLTILSNPNRTLADILFRNSLYFYLLVIIAVTFGLVFRKALGEWIDRKFFREQYDQDKILRELIEDVKKFDSMAEMSELVSRKVDRALHPESMYLFYRGEEQSDLSLGYSTVADGSPHSLRIPEDFQLLRFAEYHGGALDFPFPQKTNLPQSEKEWLARLDINLIVPMTGTDNRLAGLFLLGAKKSEVPYTTSDRQLLETLAGQIALLYENVRLKEHVSRAGKINHEAPSRAAAASRNDVLLLKECPQCGACYDNAATVCEKDETELTLTLPVERNIDNRYRLDWLIGKGGMGAVYEAWDTRLNRSVAVKILTTRMFGNDSALRRFEREAQASARLSHPNIITVYDYGALGTEGAYLVMELARGETLGARLKREHYLPPPVVADLFAQVLSGIASAHDAGVVHRDLKPENILLSSNADGGVVVTARILDFGLAKAMQPDLSESAPTQVTTPGAVIGTFGYMSPEQLTGGDTDHRSDLFSIGVIIVETLTGRLPFGGKTYHELLANTLQTTFHLKSDTPDAQHLDAVLQKCLAKDPAERFDSAAAMGRELIPALRSCSSFAAYDAIKSEADTFILEK